MAIIISINHNISFSKLLNELYFTLIENELVLIKSFVKKVITLFDVIQILKPEKSYSWLA